MDVVQCLGADFYGEARPTFLSLISFTLHDLPLLMMWEPPSSIYTRGFASRGTSLSSFSTSYPCLEKMTVEKCPKLERSHDLTFIRGYHTRDMLPLIRRSSSRFAEVAWKFFITAKLNASELVKRIKEK
ncbi:hypothetical protein MKX03_005623 [Papaver bracteatum]|nr:hypothetical protein MKX03_005623 [Papaver bracteatum]